MDSFRPTGNDQFRWKVLWKVKFWFWSGTIRRCVIAMFADSFRKFNGQTEYLIMLFKEWVFNHLNGQNYENLKLFFAAKLPNIKKNLFVTFSLHLASNSGFRWKATTTHILFGEKRQRHGDRVRENDKQFVYSHITHSSLMPTVWIHWIHTSILPAVRLQIVALSHKQVQMNIFPFFFSFIHSSFSVLNAYKCMYGPNCEVGI